MNILRYNTQQNKQNYGFKIETVDFLDAFINVFNLIVNIKCDALNEIILISVIWSYYEKLLLKEAEQLKLKNERSFIMTKKAKRIVSSVIATLVVSTSVTGLISIASYGNFYFELSGSSNGYSNPVQKSVIHSTSDYADVLPTSGLAASCPIGIGVADYYSHTMRAQTIWFNSVEGKHIPYTYPSPGGGEDMVLKGTAGYYYTKLGGYWEP